MRIITGSARGRKLITPENYEIRPTSENVKEAIFSSINFDIEDSVFLDLFAGTGQMGLEALSRGAKAAVFVDNSPEAVKIVRKNVENTGFLEKAQVVSMPFSTFLKTNQRNFDIAFIDPPYGRKLVQKALSKISDHMSDRGIIICEHEGDKLPDEFEGFKLYKNYKYGATYVSVFKREVA